MSTRSNYHSNNFVDVQRFHEKFEQTAKVGMRLLDPEPFRFRLGFMREELNELLEAHTVPNLEDAVDAIIDLHYVILGTLYLMGHFFHHCYSAIADRCELYGVPRTSVPCLLREPHVRYDVISRKLEAFEDAHVHGDRYVSFALTALGEAAVANLATAYQMGMHRFDEHWMLVHEKNMSKRLAKSVDESKRGYRLDVVKPEGWFPPDHRPLLLEQGVPLAVLRHQNDEEG